MKIPTELRIPLKFLAYGAKAFLDAVERVEKDPEKAFEPPVLGEVGDWERAEKWMNEMADKWVIGHFNAPKAHAEIATLIAQIRKESRRDTLQAVIRICNEVADVWRKSPVHARAAEDCAYAIEEFGRTFE